MKLKIPRICKYLFFDKVKQSDEDTYFDENINTFGRTATGERNRGRWVTTL